MSMVYVIFVLIFGVFIVTIEQCRVNHKILKDIEELKNKK